AFFGGEPVAENVGPDGQDLALDTLPVHRLKPQIDAQDAVEEGADLLAVLEAAAWASGRGLHQIDAILRPPPADVVENVGRHEMRVNIDCHAALPTDFRARTSIGDRRCGVDIRPRRRAIAYG